MILPIMPIIVPMPIVSHGGGNISSHELGIFLLGIFMYLLWVIFSFWVSDIFFDYLDLKGLLFSFTLTILLPLLGIALYLI